MKHQSHHVGLFRILHVGRRGLSLTEGLVLMVGLICIGEIGFAAHRWLWHAAELFSYRATMVELTQTLQAMPSRAATQRRTIQLRVDAPHGAFELAAIEDRPTPYEMVERTIWLPNGLHISDAPTTLTALPTGQLSSGSIVVTAPSYNRLFRVTTNEHGRVQLHEESML